MTTRCRRFAGNRISVRAGVKAAIKRAVRRKERQEEAASLRMELAFPHTNPPKGDGGLWPDPAEPAINGLTEGMRTVLVADARRPHRAIPVTFTGRYYATRKG